MKNSLYLDKVMQLCRGKELQPFPFLRFPFFHFFICQPSIDSSLPFLPYLPSFPFTFTFYFPSLSLPQFLIFLFPSQPSSFLLNLPHSLSSFLIPSQSSPSPPNLPHSLSIFSFPSQSSPFPPNLPRPYFSSSLPISSPTYPLSSLPPPYLTPFPPFHIFPLLPFPFSFHFPPFFFPHFLSFFLPFPSSWVFDFFLPQGRGGRIL